MSQIIIGAGPIGLAAAAHVLERGGDPVVLEAGDRPAAAVDTWAHVALFSPWSKLIDPAARRLLESGPGWSGPDPDRYPTGGEWRRQYLVPLAQRLGDRVRLGTRVITVGRVGHDLMDDHGRVGSPYQVVVDVHGHRRRVQGDAVIDASGTIGSPNPLGADGLAVPGETMTADIVTHRIPDAGDELERQALAGRRIAVVGAGHSAMTAVLALVEIARTAPDTELAWIRRRPIDDRQFGGGAGDQLAQRGALGQAAHDVVRRREIVVQDNFRIQAVHRTGQQVLLENGDGRTVGPFDRVFSMTGFRPDLSILAEVRLDLDPSVQAPRALGPLIDPNVHSCGTVPPHGAGQLAHPDERLFIAGMKSYGRAPTFLAATGFEQVRSIAAHLAGDLESSRRVELQLPSTGAYEGERLPQVDTREMAACC